jgi:flagellar biosynthesis chaperone FliJ
MGNVNLFDAHNRINFPTPEQVASLPAEAQQRFKAVADAKAVLDTATKHRESIEKRIKECGIERHATAEQMNTLRPSGTDEDRTRNIKAHILSEQQQRRRERGLE